MSVDERLRDYGDRWRVAQPPPPVVDLDRLVGRGRRPGGRGWVPIGAVAAVVALVVGGIGAAATLLPGSTRPAPVVGASGGPTVAPSPGTAAAPPGTRPLSYHNVQIFVPTAWATNAVHCGTPIRDTVFFGEGPTQTCLINRPPKVSSADLVPLFAPSPAPAEPVVVDGEPGQRGTRELADGSTEITLVLPASAVVLIVTSPDTVLAERIVDSARIVDVDAAGCPTRPVRLDPPAGAPARPGAAQALVPGTPTSAALCRYSKGWLSRSVALTGDKLSTLVRTLNALPAGVTAPRSPLGAAQVACDEDETRGIVATFRYGDGPDLAVYARISRCRPPIGAGNGAYHVQLTWPLVKGLLDLVGYDDGFVNPDELHPLTTSPTGS